MLTITKISGHLLPAAVRYATAEGGEAASAMLHIAALQLGAGALEKLCSFGCEGGPGGVGGRIGEDANNIFLGIVADNGKRSPRWRIRSIRHWEKWDEAYPLQYLRSSNLNSESGPTSSSKRYVLPSLTRSSSPTYAVLATLASPTVVGVACARSSETYFF